MTAVARLNVATRGFVPEFFDVPQPIEKVTRLNVWNYGPSLPHKLPDRVRFADILIPDCREGDILDVRFSYQVTSELNYYVEICEAVVLTQSPVGINGLMICDETGTNFNLAIHHKANSRSGIIRVPSDGDWYVAAVVYAGGSSQSHSGDTINVDMSYGQLQVLRFRV